MMSSFEVAKLAVKALDEKKAELDAQEKTAQEQFAAARAEIDAQE